MIVLATTVFLQARALARHSREDADKKEDEDAKKDDDGKKDNEGQQQQQQRMQWRSAGRGVGPSGSIGEPPRFFLTARGARVHLYGDCRALGSQRTEAREACRVCLRRAAGGCCLRDLDGCVVLTKRCSWHAWLVPRCA